MFVKFRKSSFIQFIASPKLTVICLLLLIVLTIWGTVYQADNGLYAAKQKFFYSWFLFIFGYLPFPGAMLVFLIIFINLISALLFRISFRFSNAGNLFTHLGISIMLVGGFFTYHYATESVLTLKEGEGNNLSSAYHNWELAVWKGGEQVRNIYAIDSDHLKNGDFIKFEELNLTLKVKEYHTNCNASLKGKIPGDDDVINASGIKTLESKIKEKEPSKNRPGIVFLVNDKKEIKTSKILLYGNELKPTSVNINNIKFNFSLQKKKYPLPFYLKLIDFKMTHYPGSEIPKSYESKVEIKTHGFSREVLISMNKPMRYKNFSIFQSSYFIARDGSEYSTFTVVKNWGRLFPYISSIIIFLGLCIHFIMMIFKKKKFRKI